LLYVTSVEQLALMEASCAAHATFLVLCLIASTPSVSSVPLSTGDSVLQFHKQASHAGLYIDAALTGANISATTRDTAVNTTLPGQVYAQLLYVEANSHQDLVIVVTEKNEVLAIDALNGDVVWHQHSLPPAQPATRLPCGNIAPTQGILGTPVIHAPTRALFLNAMATYDAGATVHHLVYALSADTGGVLDGGWPVDVAAGKPPPPMYRARLLYLCMPTQTHMPE
jgi:hypothetical protein